MGSSPAGTAILKDFYGRTKEEAERKYQTYRAEHPSGPPNTDQRQLLNVFLAMWVETIIKVHDAISTYEDYLSAIDLHIAETIGRIPLCELTRLDVQNWLNAIAASGKGRTAQKAHAILRAALNYAIDCDILEKNVAQRVRVPTYKARKAKALTAAQVQAFLLAASGRLDLRKPIMRRDKKPMTPIKINPRLDALYLLYISCGFRRGEPLALRWADVDMDTGELHISKSLDKYRREGPPKTESSVRTLYLDSDLIEALKAHRTRLQAEQHQEGWKPDGLIFPSIDGTPLSPRNLMRHFKTVLAAAGLPLTIRIHDLRHTSGSLMLADGAPMHDVSETLGHSSSNVTRKVYAHSYEEGKRKAVAGVGRRLKRKEGDG